MRPRTKRQCEIFDYIQEFVESHGYAPSYQQIAVFLGVQSKSGVAKHIAAIEEQGLLTRRRVNGHFRLELNPTETLEELIVRVDWLDLPEPFSELIPDYELIIPASIAGKMLNGKLRGFIVPDNAMKNEHILRGDIALIERREFARDRDCVVVAIRDEKVLLSNFRRDGANIELIPANDGYDRLTCSADQVEILGVYKGIMRPFF
jgi:repressor LexA